MRKTKISLACLALLATLALPATTSAQSIYAGGGANFTTGDYGDVADTGWLGVLGLLIPVGGDAVAVGVEGLYGQNGFSSEFESLGVSGNWKGYGVMGIVDISFGDPDGVSPYVFAGAGLLVTDASVVRGDGTEGTDAANDFGYEGGAGLAFPLGGNVLGWIEGRYVGSDIQKYFGLLAGLAIGLGS